MKLISGGKTYNVMLIENIKRRGAGERKTTGYRPTGRIVAEGKSGRGDAG